MRQTLLRIPLDADFSFGFFTVPGFGLGLVLGLWILFGAIWLYLNRKQIQPNQLVVPSGIWLVIAFVIVMLPDWVQRGPRSVIDTQTVLIQQQEARGSQTLEPLIVRGKAREQVYLYEYAADDYQIAIDLAPSQDVGYLHLAWLKATCPNPAVRDGEKSLALAQTAFEKAGARATAVHWDTLAAAHAENGEFDKALPMAQNAARAAEASTNDQIRGRLSEIRKRIELFENEKAFREPRFAQSFPQSLPVRGYGFLMFCGFIAAGLTATTLARRVGLPADAVWDIGIWTLFSGIVGARIFYLVQKRDTVFDDVSGLEYLLVPFKLQEGGLVLLGGVLFGSGVFFGYCYYRKIKPLLMADIAIPAFFVALAFGRLGCLMNGCCYGDRCELPWAIQFPLGSVPDMALVFRGFVSAESPWTMPLHPSQIYSSLNALILAFLTATYFRYRNRDGAVLAMGMLTYPITRFSIEYLRGDEIGQFGTGLTISQLVSLGLFLGGLVFAFWLSRRPQNVTPAQSLPRPSNSPQAGQPAKAAG